MSLYNLHKSIILEGNVDEIRSAIEGKYAVNIWYRDVKTNNLTKRYVFIYGIGTNKKGNQVIRAFQAFGGSNSQNSKWKTFLVNNISKIEATNLKFYKPIDSVSGGEGIPKYKGQSDKSMQNGTLQNYVKF
jgi:predicted DNA-binding transcriptional regulator YafY